MLPLIDAKGDRIGQALGDFVHDFGIPQHLTYDGAMVQVGRKTKFQELLRKHNIDHHRSSPRRPNENPSESAIRDVKRRMYHIGKKKQVPPRLWDFMVIWVCETGNLTVSSSIYANGRTPLEIITGETPDISEYMDFGFYDWVFYRANARLGPSSIGRWLGVSHKVGQLMSYWILTLSAKVISCVTVQRVTESELLTDECRNQTKKFMEHIEERLDTADSDIKPGDYGEIPEWNRMSIDEDDNDFNNEFNRVVNDESIPEADDVNEEEEYTTEAFDNYINMEIGLPRGDDGGLYHAVVKRRATDVNGKPYGVDTGNPLTDS